MFMKNSKYMVGALSLATALTMSANVEAETSKQEFAAISKIVSLSHDIPAGEVEFAVVFDPASPASVADKDAVKALIGGGFKAPKHTFKFKEVAIGDVAGAASPILFMSEGLSADSQKQTLNTATSKKALSLTTSLPYVESGNCVIGVDVGGSVKIIMNGAAYKASKLKFDAAFEFMVKEI